MRFSRQYELVTPVLDKVQLCYKASFYQDVPLTRQYIRAKQLWSDEDFHAPLGKIADLLLLRAYL